MDPWEETEPPIWEIIAEIGEQISEEEWEHIPKDGSINYRHYLYGHPRQESNDGIPW